VQRDRNSIPGFFRGDEMDNKKSTFEGHLEYKVKSV
jgi:hypothetical protein